MKRVIAKAYFGFVSSEHEEEFEFAGNVPDYEIDDVIWEWATSFLDTVWEVVYEEEDDND